MGIALLDLGETALSVAEQALGKRAGKPDSGGLAREAHIVAHCIRKEEGHSYAELVDRVSLTLAVLTASASTQTRRLIQSRSTTHSTGSRSTSGERCCAFPRSNTRNLATSLWTAGSSSATKYHSSISSGVAGASERSKRRR